VILREPTLVMHLKAQYVAGMAASSTNPCLTTARSTFIWYTCLQVMGGHMVPVFTLEA
jgi:hypothetical protein